MHLSLTNSNCDLQLHRLSKAIDHRLNVVHAHLSRSVAKEDHSIQVSRWFHGPAAAARQGRIVLWHDSLRSRFCRSDADAFSSNAPALLFAGKPLHTTVSPAWAGKESNMNQTIKTEVSGNTTSTANTEEPIQFMFGNIDYFLLMDALVETHQGRKWGEQFSTVLLAHLGVLPAEHISVVNRTVAENDVSIASNRWWY